MPKINERILNAADLEKSDEDEKNRLKETRLVTDMPEYGEIRIPKTWKKPPALADLKHDVEQASIEHTKEVSRVNQYLDFYHTTGVGRPKKEPGRSNAQPQSIRKAAEWRYSHLSEPFLDSPRLFKAEPSSELDIEGTKQSGIVLNNQMNNKINKTDFIDDYIKDLVDTGTAIIRTGWEFEEIEREVDQEVVKYVEEPKLEQTYARLFELMQTNPIEFKKTIPEEVAQALRMSMEQDKVLRRVVVRTEKATIVETTKNHPSLEICDYRDVIPDPTCKGKQDKMQFCGYRIRTTKADLYADPRYSNVDMIEVTPALIADRAENLNTRSSGEEVDQDDPVFQFKDTNRQPIEGIEYWGFVDVIGEGILTPVVFTWIGDVLVRAEENPFPDKKIPFNFVAYLKRRNSLYGEPDGVLLTEDQKISGAITRGVIDILAKNANGQRAVPKGALDYSNYRLFKAGKDFEYNPTAQLSRDGIASVTKFPEIPQSALQIKTMAENDIKEMTGTLPGGGSQSHGAAVGTQVESGQPVLSKAARRELGILRRIVDGITQVGKKMCAMNQELLDDEEIIRITDNQFVTIRREDLDCQYDLTLSISTAEDDATKAGELSFLLQTSTDLEQEFRLMLLGDIAELRRMPEQAARYRNYQPTPNPMDVRIKELEVLKLEREVQEIESRIAENGGETAREYATASNQEGQGRLAHAKADAVNLKYLEDESGVSHQRDVEQVLAQSKGNMDLETHKDDLERGREADGITDDKKPIDTPQDNLTTDADRSKNSPTQQGQTPEELTKELEELGNLDDILGGEL